MRGIPKIFNHLNIGNPLFRLWNSVLKVKNGKAGELIINNFENGLSARQNISFIKRSRSTVHEIIKRFNIQQLWKIKQDQTNGKYFPHPKDGDNKGI